MFVHLRLHTEFSVVDGTCRINDVINAAAADSQPALASAMETTDRRHQDRWGEKVDADKAMGDKTSMQMPHARPQMCRKYGRPGAAARTGHAG